MTMKYSDIVPFTMVDGEGIRVSLYVSGCRNHCNGCFNQNTWDFSFGERYTWETKEYVLRKLNRWYIDGLSILGGEPFEPENQRVLIDLVHDVKYLYPEKTVWIYSGYTYEQLIDPERHPHCNETDLLLNYCDILVDGKFDIEQKDLLLRYRGSRNQRIIDLKQTQKEGRIITAYMN